MLTTGDAVRLPGDNQGDVAGSVRLPDGGHIVFVGTPAADQIRLNHSGTGSFSTLGGPGVISLEIDDAVAGGGWIPRRSRSPRA